MKASYIECPKCKKRSYNSYDISNKYCGNCHQHTDIPNTATIAFRGINNILVGFNIYIYSALDAVKNIFKLINKDGPTMFMWNSFFCDLNGKLRKSGIYDIGVLRRNKVRTYVKYDSQNYFIIDCKRNKIKIIQDDSEYLYDYKQEEEIIYSGLYYSKWISLNGKLPQKIKMLPTGRPNWSKDYILK